MIIIRLLKFCGQDEIAVEPPTSCLSEPIWLLIKKHGRTIGGSSIFYISRLCMNLPLQFGGTHSLLQIGHKSCVLTSPREISMRLREAVTLDGVFFLKSRQPPPTPADL